MEQEYYSKEFGFYPNTSVETIVNHLAMQVAANNLDEIEGYGNLHIALQIPVWPETINGRKLRYYESKKAGNFECKEVDNILINDTIKMDFNNIPDHPSLSTNDFKTLPLQFLIVSSENKKLEGKIAFLKPSTTNLMRFKYNGIVMTALFDGSLLMLKEV